MEFGLFVLGAIVGWGAALFFDVVYYRQSASFTRTLTAAQGRIDALQTEVATLRQQETERVATPSRSPEHDRSAPEASATDEHPRLESVNPDHARIAELEERLEVLRRESAESDRRARLFEARLIDASSELASLRYGLPTLDRKAEDELETPLA